MWFPRLSDVGDVLVWQQPDLRSSRSNSSAHGQRPQITTAAESWLSPEDLKKERDRAKHKNNCKRGQPTKKTDKAELQIEGWKCEWAKLTIATPRRTRKPPEDTPPHKGAALSACTTHTTPPIQGQRDSTCTIHEASV